RGRPGFDAGEQALLKRLAAQVAPVVHSHQLHRQARRQAYQLQQLRQQLAQAPEPEGVDRGLVEDAAHALRTPLTAIKGYSSSLLQSDLTWTPEVQHEFLKTIDREADRLERVVSDLLASPVEPSALSPSAVRSPPHSGRGRVADG
ncbi:MAG TPA: histidine kinase dimerization/phospho-acceptor domain-containing protein, partial [Dehalococcoidia bacterium]|nr:histidine kinase dimerization/phospho-acceptor domain-containing protein [Dehalococcoidia bacterium]